MNATVLSRRRPRLGGLLATCLLACHAGAGAANPVRLEIFAPGVISATGNVDAVTFAPDGSFIVFCSNRPASPGGKALDATTFDGRVRAGNGSHLWRVDRVGSGWGEPVPLPPAVNDDTRLYSPSVVGDGSLYYQRPDPVSRTFHLMRSQYANGRYQAPVPVVIGPHDADERDPAVAPDESFIVFSTKRPPGQPVGRLVIALRSGDHWGVPVDLGDEVNRDGAEGPHLGPDGRTVYIDSAATFEVAYPRTRAQTTADLERARQWDNGNSHLWSFSLASWLDGRPEAR